MDTLSKFIVPGVIFILIVIFGFLLSNAGKPYNGILFNIHKMIALGVVMICGLQIFNMIKGNHIPILPLILLTVAGICVVALFATGALMSIGKLSFEVALAVHRIAPVLLIVTIIMSIFLLREIKL